MRSIYTRCPVEAIVNRTGERRRARKAADLQDRSALLALRGGRQMVGLVLELDRAYIWE